MYYFKIFNEGDKKLLTKLLKPIYKQIQKRCSSTWIIINKKKKQEKTQLIERSKYIEYNKL